MTTRGPTLADVNARGIREALAGVRVAIPARVESYDASKQLVDAQPLIKDAYLTESGELKQELPGVVRNVPVIFPGASGFRVTFPVHRGDTVLLLFCDRSIDKWKSYGGEVAPSALHTHHLTDAVAIPGLHPSNAPSQGADPDVITIGSDGGSDDFAATAQRVLTELNKLKTAFDGHTHAFTPTGVTPGSGSGTPGVTLGAAASPSLSAPASATVKVRG